MEDFEKKCSRKLLALVMVSNGISFLIRNFSTSLIFRPMDYFLLLPRGSKKETEVVFST